MKTHLKSWGQHINQKAKGIKYSDRELVDLLKKEMKKNRHNGKDICEKYGIDENEFEALISKKYCFNMNWYEVLSDCTGIAVMELASCKQTSYSKLCVKIGRYKYSIACKFK